MEDNDEKIFNSLEQIKDGQHNQNLINQNEFHFGLYQQREVRISKQKENQNIKDIKMWVLGLVGTSFFNRSSIKNVFGV